MSREIKRYVNHDARKRWEADLEEWLEDQDRYGANREQRAAFWFLLELKSAEALIVELQKEISDMRQDREHERVARHN